MSEATQQTPVEQEPAEAIAQPQKVDDSVFDDLYRQTVGIPVEQAPEQAQPVQQAAPQEPTEDEAHALKEQLNQLKGALAMQAAQQQNAQQNAQQAPQAQKTLEQTLLDDNPDLDPKAIQWMVKTAGTIAEKQVEERLQPLQREFHELKNFAQVQANERTVSQFDEAMDSLASQAGIQDEYTKNVLKDAVTARGLRQYGQNFNLDAARKLFRDANNERLQQGHAQQTQYVTQKQTMQNDAPPVSHAQSNAGTAIESLQNQIRDPNNRNMDMRSQGMTEAVSRFLDAGDKAINSLLGGPKKE